VNNWVKASPTEEKGDFLLKIGEKKVPVEVQEKRVISEKGNLIRSNPNEGTLGRAPL